MPIMHLNAVQDKSLIREADKPVLVAFSAPWCVYCRRLAPALEATAETSKIYPVRK